MALALEGWEDASREFDFDEVLGLTYLRELVLMPTCAYVYARGVCGIRRGLGGFGGCWFRGHFRDSSHAWPVAQGLLHLDKSMAQAGHGWQTL